MYWKPGGWNFLFKESIYVLHGMWQGEHDDPVVRLDPGCADCYQRLAAPDDSSDDRVLREREVFELTFRYGAA